MADKKLEDLPQDYTNLGYDDDESAPGPSAPKSSEDTVQESYTVCAPVPTAPDHDASIDLGPPPLYYSTREMVFEEIYEACALYVKKHCCYGSRFLRQMKLTSIVNKGVFQYTLESFGEKRETTYRDRPYRGGPVDGPENGRPPNPWDMVARPQVLFQKSSTDIRIPHTETVQICSKCNGIGKVRCSSCSGRGTNTCYSCSGRGRDSENRTCSSCSGSGRRRCISCSGDGRVTCSKCSGYGKVINYRVLIVTWENHISEFISEKGNLPDANIHKAEGTELLRQAHPSLLPITNAPDPSVNNASASLLLVHKTAFPSELIIHQRQILRVVPYTRVSYKWKEREGEFYVYGLDKTVYFEDYPQKCCCCTCC